MRPFFIILNFFFFHPGCSQTKITDEPLAGRKEPEFPTDIITCGIGPAAHPKNQEKWKEYLIKNLVLDDASLDTIPPGTYRAIVQFVVDKDGRLNDVKIVMDPGYGLGKRVNNIISQYKDRWIPAVFNGRKEPAYYRQPITFAVEEEKQEKCSDPLPANLIL